jgi:hypothetical protein
VLMMMIRLAVALIAVAAQPQHICFHTRCCAGRYTVWYCMNGKWQTYRRCSSFFGKDRVCDVAENNNLAPYSYRRTQGGAFLTTPYSVSNRLYYVL